MIAEELIFKIQRGEIDGARELLNLFADSISLRVEQTPEYVYAMRLAINRDDGDMCEMLSSILDDNHVFDADTVTAAAYKSHHVFLSVVGAAGHGLQNSALMANHPLVAAAAAGQRDNASFIIKHVKLSDALRDESLIAAATSNSVSICKLLISSPADAKLAMTVLVRTGHSDSVLRLLDQDIDFAANKYELLRLVAPFPLLLHGVMQHPSLLEFRDKMPTIYSQFAMDNAMIHHDEKVEELGRTFEKQLTLHATCAVGCSTRDAVTHAYSELHPRYMSLLSKTNTACSMDVDDPVPYIGPAFSTYN